MLVLKMIKAFNTQNEQQGEKSCLHYVLCYDTQQTQSPLGFNKHPRSLIYIILSPEFTLDLLRE